MKRSAGFAAILSFFVCFAIVCCVAQASAPAADPSSQATPAPEANQQQQQTTSTGQQADQRSQAAQSHHAAVIPVQLSKSLDAKKLKAGDPVEAKTAVELRTGTGTVIPRGSKVTGHITQAEARSNGGSQSSLGMTFDHIALKDGQQVPLKTTIQAVAAPPSTSTSLAAPPDNGQQRSDMPSGGMSSTGMGANRPTAGGNSSAGTSPAPANETPQPPASATSSPALTPQSTGVLGIRDLQLGADSTLTSSGKDVKLDSGTEMILRVQNQ